MCANVRSNNVLSVWLSKGQDLVSLWPNIHSGLHSGHASIRFLLPRSDGISREFDSSPKMHKGQTDIKKWPLRAVIKLAVFRCMLVPLAFCRACLLGFKTSSKCSHVRLAREKKSCYIIQQCTFSQRKRLHQCCSHDGVEEERTHNV